MTVQGIVRGISGLTDCLEWSSHHSVDMDSPRRALWLIKKLEFGESFAIFFNSTLQKQRKLDNMT